MTDVSHTVTLETTGDTFPAAPGRRLLDAARESGFWLPFECGWGSCGTCKATLVSGEVESLLLDAPASSERDARRGRILLCQSAALSDLTIRPLRVETEAPAGRRTRAYDAIVLSIDEVAPSVVDLRLDAGEPVDFRPGQFAILDDGAGLRRCYSLAGAPGDRILRFVLKRGGPMSTWVASLAAGDRVIVEAPYGDVWIRPGDRDLLLMAGGTGISAILSLAREAVAQHPHRRVTVVYGARTGTDLALLDELAGILAPHTMADLIALAQAPGDRPGVREGQVTLPLDQIDLTACDVYLAGPPAMVDAVEADLAERGVQRDRLFVDRFG